MKGKDDWDRRGFLLLIAHMLIDKQAVQALVDPAQALFMLTNGILQLMHIDLKFVALCAPDWSLFPPLRACGGRGVPEILDLHQRERVRHVVEDLAEEVLD